MLRVLSLPAIAGVAISLTAYKGRLPGPNATLLADRLGIPARWNHELRNWLLSPKERLVERLGCASYLALAVFGVLEIGWLRGVGLLLVAGLIGLWLGARSNQPAGPLLETAVGRARKTAATFLASGDEDRASAASDLAERIVRYMRRAPTLTAAEISRLPRARRPSEIADLIEGWVRNRSLDDSQELSDWLESEEWSPFPEDTNESRRVQLLERVKREIIAGGGEQYADDERLIALAAELRAFPD